MRHLHIHNVSFYKISATVLNVTVWTKLEIKTSRKRKGMSLATYLLQHDYKHGLLWSQQVQNQRTENQPYISCFQGLCAFSTSCIFLFVVPSTHVSNHVNTVMLYSLFSFKSLFNDATKYSKKPSLLSVKETRTPACVYVNHLFSLVLC